MRKRSPRTAVSKRPARTAPKSERIGTLAKITCPDFARASARPRLFGWLDDARRRHPVIWLQSPPGSGKTTLIATYLNARKISPLWYQVDAGDNDIASFFYYLGLATKRLASRHRTPMPLLAPEYMQNLPVFTRNYFRELFSRLKTPAILVLDNYQEAEPDSALHDVLRYALDEVPPGVNFIILSRTEPPAVFARPRIAGHLAELGWTQMQLTKEESLDMATLRRGRANREMVLTLHEQTHGWAAGFVLMLEQLQLSPMLQDLSTPQSQTALFDYFASEIFRHATPVVQEFLLKTSVLPKISVRAAREISGVQGAARILGDLARRNYFTVQHSPPQSSYEYHPLFRAFLIDLAASRYSGEQIKQLKRRGAQLLAEHGEIEAAVALLQEAEDWSTAMQLILSQASMLVSQCRSQTLAAWLQRLPDQLREQNPWTIYWLGVCRLPFSPPEARGYLERAFALFEAQLSQDDASPLYLTWSAIVDSFVLEWNTFVPLDHWLDVYPTLQKNRRPPSPEVEAASIFSYVTGLIYRRPDDPNIPVFASRAEELFLGDVDRWAMQGASLIYIYMWKREFVRADYLLRIFSSKSVAIHVNPVVGIMWRALKALHAYFTCAPEESIRSAEEGLALAEVSGIHIFDYFLLGDHLRSHLWRGNIAAARDVTGKMEKMRSDRYLHNAFGYYCSASVSIYDGNIARAVDEYRRAVRSSAESGSSCGEGNCWAAFAYALAKRGEVNEAMEAVQKAASISMCTPSNPLLRYSSALTEAMIRNMRGETAQTQALLAEGLAQANADGRYAPPDWFLPEDVAILYNTALEYGIASDYVRAAITRNRLVPPRHSVSEQWPFPLRFYTLGRFVIVKNDKPLTVSGKTQKKPLELLKALLAFGGRGVATATLAQALWPDADVDVAQRTFDTTLHRLRKLLGEDSAIASYNGQLSFNPAYCWVDAWAFERLLGPANDIAIGDNQVKKALALYQGPFLDRDDAYWALASRERLRSKLLRALVRRGQSLEAATHWALAAEWYLKCIEVDHLAEELYRRLMHSYYQLNRRAEAMAVYERCRRALHSVLGIEPGQETKALYKKIQGATS